ncbi:alpha-hydroxy-acid oxidizing protein [Actinoallomurus sp. NBC_01490]|uniref:alpha-hydroxy acid oxidase n=1 Tax=Actinoallomurus sp. NBC_01490 TaxID=2903557 RepID=UPI002E31FF2D|nr:alpha-hydroxy acid oxidase [Actinoallomurus sp. NBC_01490]
MSVPHSGYRDLQDRARRALDPAVFDFFAGGSGDESTLAANTAAWRRVALRPHVLRDVSSVDTRVRVLGRELPAPVCVAPMGYQVLAHPGGEVATARGARRAGALLTVSSRSSRRIEEVAAEAGPWWFQVYVLRDRGLTADLVRRAAAGASALALTGDTPYLGRRRRDRDPALIPDEIFGVNLGDGFDRALAEQAADVTYDDIAWLAEISGLPVVVKGVLRGDDARDCAAAGAAGVWVSNHGGRQLDGAVATAVALPEVADAVGDRVEVYADGGIRTGTDVLRALALGARAVFVGRPVLWHLATGGEDAVADGLTSLSEELAHAMGLAGVTTTAAIGRGLCASPTAGT